VRFVFLTTDQLDVFGGSSRFWTSAARLPRRCTVQVNFLDNQQLDVSTSYLEIFLSSALSPNLYECADYRLETIRSSAFKRHITIKAIKINKKAIRQPYDRHMAR